MSYLNNLKQSFIINKLEYNFLSDQFDIVETDAQREYISYWLDQCVECELDYLEAIGETDENYRKLLDELQEAARKADPITFYKHVEFLERIGLESKSINDIKNMLSVRTFNILVRNGISKVKQLHEMSLKQLSSLRNVSGNTVAELEEVLKIKFS